MSSPVTWYRIMNLVVVLGLAIAKYVSGSANVGKVDLVFAIISGGVLYFIGWWEKTPGLQWYFEPDWQAQPRAMISCVVKLKDHLGSVIHKVISIYASELICVLLLIFQIPVILMLAGIRLYQGESIILNTLISFGILISSELPFLWTIKRHSLTCFERIFLGITAVLYLYFGIRFAIISFRVINGHKDPLWVHVLFALFVLFYSLAGKLAW
ncbi:hypothetical protein M378DRAFT_160658 [Amanita muscaria Koide BX008]|uniref:Uncharacterized protein n=1 Tax=Amanita muscaria (strain Koide BX008) TaxID=946122 RepID=A0A0C2XCT5_AMAMK|nr:hypothetical protein M378DRAFT_160658 [Amanita muscaria Koide BX008]